MSKLEKVIRDINESGYEDGTHGAGHPASIEEYKDTIKGIFTELLGEVEARSTDDTTLQSWSNEDYKAFGKNELKVELLNKIAEL